MHEYDIALKKILTRPDSTLLNLLTGSRTLEWLNVELPRVSNQRVDLLGRSPDGALTHIELQSRNEQDFPLRMAEYVFGIGRRYGRIPRQVVLYVGQARLRMPSEIKGPDYFVRFHMVDIREVETEPLLSSRNSADTVMAILTRSGGDPGTVRRILDRIAVLSAGKREQAFEELMIVAGLRKLYNKIRQETKQMPILNDIMDHGIIGPAIRQGRVEGRVEGERALLRRQLEKKFGRIPSRFGKRLDALKPVDVEAAALRLLDAMSLEDLFA